MKDSIGFPQLILRLALGLGFILPVMDRLGMLGAPGAEGVAWGDWPHFIAYTETILPFLNKPLVNVAGALASTAEAIFGICLIIGFKTKQAAFGSGVLTLIFGICMALFLNIQAPFKYPVFVFVGAGFVLSGVSRFKWSVDELLTKKAALK
ncbi:MAG: hypothetical protein J7623_28240 [Chitinophaga sp.]|uniref:hypothetical protein n=1 Tax=Chitinophaga sp. TaxID=1869181 RepID=UPI001B031F8D|nr:hypothetical protein [Chitinophaga sp.]MBO9732566.1 hypothetical protein [Chitinophaga sp.]